MNIFNLRKRFFIWLIVLILGMAFFHIFNKETRQDPLTRVTYFLFSEIQTASVNFSNGLSELIKKYFFLLNLRERNEELEKKNKEIKTQYQLFEEILKENERLKSLLKFPSNNKFDFLPAQIIGTDFLSKNELFTINKGSVDGVKKFMGVLHPKAIVGYVFRVSPHSSQVISLLNPLSSLPARNRRSRVTGLIEAGKSDSFTFNYLERIVFKDKQNKDFKIGDPIVTIESDQFPSGFLVGSILSLDYSSKKLSPRIFVKPAIKFYSLEEVLIVFNSIKNQKIISRKSEAKDNENK